MKKIIFVLVAAAMLYSCSKTPSYQITGTVQDSVESTIFLMQRVDGEMIPVDSAQIVDGKFMMEGVVDVAEEYYLKKGERDFKMLFVENVDITVSADSALIKDAKVEGGSAQATFNQYNEKYDNLYGAVMDKYQAARMEKDEAKKETMMAEVDSLYENVQQYQSDFMLENTSSPVAAHILTRIQYGKTASELDSLHALLDVSLEGMKSYQSIAKRIEALKRVEIGATAPDFTQNDADGNPIKFSDIYSANKVTLIDFWASWCGPCRAENPNVVDAFKKYNDKGFTVFGVSLDNSKERWLEAIEDDQLTWEHVSNLEGWNNPAAKDYAVNSIPASFLVDQNGVILGANLRGEDLHTKLAELLD